MASLGQLTAGIAHEINNPINFVYAGINSLKTNINDLLEILSAYEEVTPDNAGEKLREVLELKEDIEYDEVLDEVNDLIESIKRGAERTTEIVKGLRTFSRLDEDDIKMADLHENLDATLSILRNHYKNRVEVLKQYGDIPAIECYPGKLNQVFMNILSNAIQAIPAARQNFYLHPADR
ncbi:MAG: HAMP domain-containing histidine kinase [Bacteroidia bacterium]|nr:HAMP domain-containing histidine kinase [Bacteroidia bacterium]